MEDLRFQSARLLLELARGTGAEWGAWIQHLCEFEAEVLHVDRVSFWSFDEQRSSLTCDSGYVARTHEFEHGAVLFASDVPEYFDALGQARTLNVGDVQSDPRARGLRDYSASRGISSMLDVPVWVGGRLRGILCHENVEGPRRWSADEEDFAVGVGQVVGSALVARANTLAEAAARRSAFLDAVSRAVHSTLDACEIARIALTFVVPRLADGSLLWMVSLDGTLECLAWTLADASQSGVIEDAMRELAGHRASPNFATRVVRQKQSLLVPQFTPSLFEAYDFAPVERAMCERLGLTTSLGVPLQAAGRTIGALVLHASGRHYDTNDLALAQDVADPIATALENARVHGIAGEAIRARDDLLVLVAHELRTPLTSLQLMADDLLRKTRLRDDAGADGEEARRAEAIARQVRRLTGLVEGVVDALRIRAEGVKLARNPRGLGSLVEECVAAVAERAQRAGSRVDVQADPSIVGLFDPARLEQALVAVLDNAVKFGGGKPIDVSLRRDGGCAELTIRDHGIGITPERRAAIFSPFERAVAKENFGGLGLGLYVARAIVEAHGGSIAASSGAGEGTTVVVRLPL